MNQNAAAEPTTAVHSLPNKKQVGWEEVVQWRFPCVHLGETARKKEAACDEKGGAVPRARVSHAGDTASDGKTAVHVLLWGQWWMPGWLSVAPTWMYISQSGSCTGWASVKGY